MAPRLFAAVLLMTGCQCGQGSISPDGGEQPDSGNGGGGGGGGSGGGGVIAGCGTCPVNQVCDEATSTCVGGCPVGQGACAAGCCPWDSVDASVAVAMSGRRPVLLLDSEDRAFIVHRGYRVNSFVSLSTQTDAGTFQHEEIYFQGNADWENDQLVEPDGGRWIAFSQLYPNNTKDVTLLHHTNDGDVFETLPNADFGTVASLAWSFGRLHVLWDRFGEDTVIALSERDDDGGWATRTVPIPRRPSWTAELRIDASGTPHIAYGVAGPPGGGVFYGVGLADGGVAFEQVDGELSTSRVVLELDSADRPHLVYYQLGDGSLHYARGDDAGWFRETVTSGGGAGWNPALVLDAQGRPHVSFQARDGGAAMYATRRGPGAWELDTVDPGPDVGSESDIALTRSGRPCIAYNVITSTYWGLRYACLP